MSREILVPCYPSLRSVSIASNNNSYEIGYIAGKEEEKEGNEEKKGDLILSIPSRRSA